MGMMNGLETRRYLSLGNKILIYENGKRYEIDSDLIYTPWFVGGNLRSIEVSKSDTVSESSKDKDEQKEKEN